MGSFGFSLESWIRSKKITGFGQICMPGRLAALTSEWYSSIFGSHSHNWWRFWRAPASQIPFCSAIHSVGWSLCSETKFAPCCFLSPTSSPQQAYGTDLAASGFLSWPSLLRWAAGFSGPDLAAQFPRLGSTFEKAGSRAGLFLGWWSKSGFYNLHWLPQSSPQKIGVFSLLAPAYEYLTPVALALLSGTFVWRNWVAPGPGPPFAETFA